MSVLLEVTLNSTYSNQQCINRWNYIGSGTPAAVSMSFALNAALGFHPSGGTPPSGTLLAALRPVLPPTVEFEQAICLNPYDPTDFDAEPFVPHVLGTLTGDVGLSPINAFGFRSNQTRRDIRRGYKRFVGVVEGANTAGGGIEGSVFSNLLTIAAIMGDTLTYDDSGNTLTFIPCIVKKEKYVVPDSDPVRHAFRYLHPLDDSGRDAQIALSATGIAWEPYTTVRSQTSRQYGKGS